MGEGRRRRGREEKGKAKGEGGEPWAQLVPEYQIPLVRLPSKHDCIPHGVTFEAYPHRARRVQCFRHCHPVPSACVSAQALRHPSHSQVTAAAALAPAPTACLPPATGSVGRRTALL